MSLTHSLSRRAWFAIAAAAIVALATLAPGGWQVAHGQTGGTTTPTPTTTTVPPTGGTVQTNPGSGGSRVTLNIPPGAFPADTTVVATPPEVVDPANLPPGIPPAPPAPAGSTTQIAAVFSLEATLPGGAPAGEFGAAVSITVDVPASVLAGVPEGGSVTLARFDEATGQWQQLPCTLSGGALSCQTTHFSLWAFIVTAPEGAPLPGQAGAPTPPDTGDGIFDTDAGGGSLGMMLGLAAVALGAVAAGGLVVARRRSGQ